MCIAMNILFLSNKNLHLLNINDRSNLKSCYPHVRGVHFSDLAKHDITWNKNFNLHKPVQSCAELKEHVFIKLLYSILFFLKIYLRNNFQKKPIYFNVIFIYFSPFFGWKKNIPPNVYGSGYGYLDEGYPYVPKGID